MRINAVVEKARRETSGLLQERLQALREALEQADAGIAAIKSAFGAPGDYGYETREGQALFDLYKRHLAIKVTLSDLPQASIPDDVRRLVIAARVVAFEDQGPVALSELDRASEAFAGRIPWDEQPPE